MNVPKFVFTWPKEKREALCYLVKQCDNYKYCQETKVWEFWFDEGVGKGYTGLLFQNKSITPINVLMRLATEIKWPGFKNKFKQLQKKASEIIDNDKANN